VANLLHRLLRGRTSHDDRDIQEAERRGDEAGSGVDEAESRTPAEAEPVSAAVPEAEPGPDVPSAPAPKPAARGPRKSRDEVSSIGPGEP
jgi:hypothetical protein